MEFLSKSEEDTKNFAYKLALELKGGEVFLLNGDLGAGKTVFAKGLCQGLGNESVVTSPTFTIMNMYKGRLNFYHFDMYRIENESELIELGFDEYIGSSDAVCAIEWSSRVPSLLPKNCITVEITKVDDETRLIKVER